MLFLFNDVVFDLGDLQTVLNSEAMPLKPAQIETLNEGQLNVLVREAVFADPNVARSKPEHMRCICALICYVAPGANALLAVRPEGAANWQAVGLRYANVPITTLAYLWGEQASDRLTPAKANSSVWACDSDPLPQATGTG